MATKVMGGIQSLEQLSRASPKEHPCQVSSRLAQWFRRRCLKKLWTTDDTRRMPDIGQLQKLTMSTLCSGELEKKIRLVQIESICRQQFNRDSNNKFVCSRLENIVGKEENAGNQHFLLFPQCFQEAYLSGSLRV